MGWFPKLANWITINFGLARARGWDDWRSAVLAIVSTPSRSAQIRTARTSPQKSMSLLVKGASRSLAGTRGA